jgi:hypothetical protein
MWFWIRLRRLGRFRVIWISMYSIIRFRKIKRINNKSNRNRLKLEMLFKLNRFRLNSNWYKNRKIYSLKRIRVINYKNLSNFRIKIN